MRIQSAFGGIFIGPESKDDVRLLTTVHFFLNKCVIGPKMDNYGPGVFLSSDDQQRKVQGILTKHGLPKMEPEHVLELFHDAHRFMEEESRAFIAKDEKDESMKREDRED